MKTEIQYKIIELGTTRSYVGNGMNGMKKPNPKYWKPGDITKWDWGAGIFTKVFYDNLENENFRMWTVDPKEKAVTVCSNIMKNKDKLNIVKDYSTTFLKKFKDKVDFIYMDHMESGEDACLQHLEDAKLIVGNNMMNDGGIILIDDTEGLKTKGKYSIPYLVENGFEVVLESYQTLLYKRV